MSESEGLIYAYVLSGDGKGHRLTWQQVDHWSAVEGVLWVHLDYEHPRAREWISQASGLDPLIQQSLLAGETRPRCVGLDNGLLINLRGVNTNPGSEPEDMVSVRVFCDGERIVTTRKRRLLSIQDISAALEKGTGPKTAGEFIASLAYRLTERMGDVIAELDDAIDGVEEEIINQASQSFRSQLVGLRREVIMLRRYLAPQREALARIQSENADWLSVENKLTLREAGDRLARFIEDLDSSRDRAAVAYEELNSQLSEQMNARMYVLSVVAALFLPLGFLTGLFGINVGGIPFADDPFGFIEIGLILIVIVILQLVIFRYKKWF